MAGNRGINKYFSFNVRGRVCIVSSFLGPDRPDASFSLGSVSNGQIRTSGTLGRALITKQGNRLGLAGIYKNAPYISAFEFPKPLKSPTDSSFFGNLVSQTTRDRIIQEFNAAGCTASLPTKQSDSTVAATGGSPNTDQSSTRTTSGQELVASNLECTRNLRTIFGQSRPDYCTSTQANSGILFDKLQVSRNSDRSIKLELKLFNQGSADGLVEVYDAKGHLVDLEIIDGNKPPTDLIRSGFDLFTKVPTSLFSKYPLDDIRRNLKEQNVSVTIPYRGYVNITKSSQFALVYNKFSLALEISQLKAGDPEFTKEASVKKFLLGFVKEAGLESRTNIFKSKPTLQGVFSLDFVDPESQQS
jgi:hypothetical protein